MPRRTHNLKQTKSRRRELRRNATAAENRLWACLKKRQVHGCKFRRQYSIGPYILDFYCVAESLGIELDGAVHDDPARRDYDAARADYLTEQGVTVLRFENRRVFEDLDTVLDAIAFHLTNRPPTAPALPPPLSLPGDRGATD